MRRIMRFFGVCPQKDNQKAECVSTPYRLTCDKLNNIVQPNIDQSAGLFRRRSYGSSQRHIAPNALAHFGRGCPKDRRGAVNLKVAFTLAEVLIALLIIGIVAAMTLPALFHNISERKNATKVAVFNSKLIQGLNLTKNADEMGPQYSSTYDFLKNGLSHHLRMTAICNSSNLEECLGYDTITYEDKKGNEKTVKVSSLTTAKKLNIKSQNFKDTAAFIMGDGTPVIMTYNLKCMNDSNIDKTISSCVAGLFDLNGKSKPNMFVNKITNGKSETRDIRSFNGASIYPCIGEINDICIVSATFGDDTYDSTTQSSPAYDKMYNLIKDENPQYERPRYNNDSANNNWQLAKDYCEQVAGGHLPSSDELAKIATELYGVEFSAETYKTKITMKNKSSVYAALGITDNPIRFTLWASEPYGTSDAWGRDFFMTRSGREYSYSFHLSSTARRAVCLGSL